jgi:hypothetical protein
MDHLEASRSQAADKYLLDQLDSKARGEFEEHFFECGICAEDVRTGVLFMDNAAAEFQADPALGRVERKPSWADFFRINSLQPAFVLPMIALLAVSGLWLRDHEQLKEQLLQPQAFNGVLIEHTRGAKAAVTVARGEMFSAVSFYIESDSFPAYSLAVDGNGMKPVTLRLKRKAHDTPYSVLLPSAKYKTGSYRITVRGGFGPDAPIVERFALNLE